MSFFHTHTHSKFSCLDALTPVPDLVATAASHGHEALGLTDHGNMAGTVQLYKECKKHGLLPFPGVEAYLVKSIEDKDAERFHLTLLALDLKGYTALVKLVSKSHTRPSFHKKPRIDMSDLAHLASTGESEHIALTTGCYFGLVQQTLARTGDIARTSSIVKMYAKWFPHTYVELQHHSISRDQNDLADDEMVEALHQVAWDAGVPVIAAHDSHYLKPADKGAHDMMKRLIIRDVEPSEAGFPGDSYHFASTAWVKRHYVKAGLKHVWNDCRQSYDDLIAMHDLRIPALENYRFYVPEVPGVDAFKSVVEYCQAAMENGPHGGKKKYEKRLRDEFEIIESKGFAGYLLHIKEITDWMRSEGIIFQTRGSAGASLVCHLLGITNLDPVNKWDLLFERFLDPTRETPPDVDLDMEDDRRDDVLAYVGKQYNVTQVGTFSSLGIRAEDGKGSVIAMYMGYVKRQYPDAEIKTIDDARKHDDEDHEHLWDLAEIEPYKAPGANAAGFVVSSPENRLEDYVPTMLIPSSNRTVTQFTKNDVEAMGFVKDDFLGLRNLTTIRRALELMGHDPTRPPDHCCDGPLEWVPDNDKDALKLLRSGKTDGLFQFEGWSNAKVARQMKVKSTKDAMVATALGRPAVLEQGFDRLYMERKNNRGEGVVYPGHVFRNRLKPTYGIIVFQEQVLQILADLGMSIEERNQLLKAVKASNKDTDSAADTFRKMRKRFEECALDVGMTQEQAETGWNMVESFAGYGFNKAHAAQYGLTGYRTAYLKTHYPLEYMAALLETTAGDDKEPQYVREARRMGIRLLGPDINRSGVSWTLDKKRKAIRKGLLSIKGVGRKAAEEIVDNAPFASLEDLKERTDSRAVTGLGKYPKQPTPTGVVLKLIGAGALTSLGIGRDGTM